MNNHPYRINVGFLINAPVGTYRDFELSESSMELADDLHADEIRCTVRASRVQQGILALNAHFEELFSFHGLRENQEAEQFLPENGYMDLGEIIREYLVMEVPYAPVCKEDCKGLCPVCGKNLNFEPHVHPEEE